MRRFITPLLDGLAVEAENPKLTEESRVALREAHARLKAADETLSCVLDAFSDRALAAQVLDACYALTGTTADAISRIERNRLPSVLDAMNAGRARYARANAPREQIIRSFIAEHFPVKPDHPYKEAEAAVAELNEILRCGGHGLITASALAERLKKIGNPTLPELG